MYNHTYKHKQLFNYRWTRVGTHTHMTQTVFVLVYTFVSVKRVQSCAVHEISGVALVYLQDARGLSSFGRASREGRKALSAQLGCRRARV